MRPAGVPESAVPTTTADFRSGPEAGRTCLPSVSAGVRGRATEFAPFGQRVPGGVVQWGRESRLTSQGEAEWVFGAAGCMGQQGVGTVDDVREGRGVTVHLGAVQDNPVGIRAVEPAARGM